MERCRNVLITYRLKIDKVEFTALSLHQVEEHQDIFVFANDLLISKGLEKMFNVFFVSEGLAEVKIKNVEIIDLKTFQLLKKLIDFPDLK